MVAVIGLAFLLWGFWLMIGPLLGRQEIRGPWYLVSLAGPPVHELERIHAELPAILS
jgi:hypothetical protein